MTATPDKSTAFPTGLRHKTAALAVATDARALARTAATRCAGLIPRLAHMHWGHGLSSGFLVATVSAIGAPATPAPTSEREMEMAKCVAALDANTKDLAARVRNGQPELRTLLLVRLKSGAAFIGTAYLSGERDEGRTKALLDSAREAQKSIPEPELAARQANCEAEGARLLAEASALERAIVSRIAERRMQRLLEK